MTDWICNWHGATAKVFRVIASSLLVLDRVLLLVLDPVSSIDRWHLFSTFGPWVVIDRSLSNEL